MFIAEMILFCAFLALLILCTNLRYRVARDAATTPGSNALTRFGVCPVPTGSHPKTPWGI